MTENLTLKLELKSEKNWADVYKWIIKEGWVGFYPELWKFIGNFADTTILIATNEKDETLGCLVYNHPHEWKMKNIMIFISHPDHRRKGIGKFLWKEMRKIVGPVPLLIRSVTPNTQMYKEKYGFSYIDSLTVVSLNIKFGNVKRAIKNLLESSRNLPEIDGTAEILSLEALSHLEPLLAYDMQISNRDRSASLLPYLEMSVSFTAIAQNIPSESVLGLCCITSEKVSGQKAGPFYAQNLPIALRLLDFVMDMCNLHEDDSLRFNVPEANREFYDFLTNLKDDRDTGLVFHTSCTQPFEHQCDWSRVYCPMSIQPDC